MKNKKQEGWYRRKSFPHLDLPLGFDQAKELVSNPSKVVSHSFLPFIGYTDSKRRFTPKSEKKYVNKERPIRYCSHRDGYIHSYYAMHLAEAYESFLSKAVWAKSVIGYRSGVGTNIHMAKNAFNEIRKRETCVAIAIDISNFFDSIDHAVLLETLKQVLDCDRLPEDWFKIFKSMTRYAWVESEELANALGIDRKNPPKPLCSIAEFRAIRGADETFVKTNNNTFGIPQGSPLSAVLSNVYMIGFDEACFDFIKSVGGFYRRYSDDIFVVCKPEHEQAVRSFIETKISELGGAMEISKDKTEVSYFTRLNGKVVICDRPISYLGFTFDGVRTTLRPRTLSRYYRRMTYGSRRAATSARKKFSSKVFKRKLYRQFSHLGKSNFYTYAKRASAILEDEMPRRQLRRHFKVLDRKIRNRGK